MGSLLGLFKLLWIAEQYETVSGLRSREDICERHLARFVHKEDVDRVQRIRPRPKPRCSAKNVNQTGIELGDGFTIVDNLLDLRWRIAFGRDLVGAVGL